MVDRSNAASATDSDPSDSRGAGNGPGKQPLALVATRVVQFLIDLGIVLVLCYGASLLMGLLPQAPDGTYANPLATIGMALLVLLATMAINVWYWVYRPASHSGQTLAMRWLRLRVVGVDRGTAATRSQLAVRLLLLAADGMFLGLVAVCAMASNPRRQRLGDMVASTTVIPVRALGGPPADSPDGAPALQDQQRQLQAGDPEEFASREPVRGAVQFRAPGAAPTA